MVGTHRRAGHDPDDMQAPGENRIRHVVIQRRRQDENKRGEKGSAVRSLGSLEKKKVMGKMYPARHTGPRF